MSTRRERELASSTPGTPRIKFEEDKTTSTPPQPTETPIDGSRSPRGGSGRSFLRSSGPGSTTSSQGGSSTGVVFKISLPSSSSSPSSSAANSPTGASSSSSLAPKSFTPRSMLNKVKHTFSMSTSDEVDLSTSGTVALSSSSSGGGGGSREELTSSKGGISTGADVEGDGKEKEQGKKFLRGGSSRHKRSRSMGDAKAAASLVQQPRDTKTQVSDKEKEKAEKADKADKEKNEGRPEKEKGHSRSGSTVLRRKGSFIGGSSFLSFSSSTTKLPRHDSAGDVIERPTDEAGEDEDQQEDAAANGTASEVSGEAAAQQRRKWGSLPRRHNSQAIKKSSTMEVLSTGPPSVTAPGSKRNTLVSEVNGNRMDRTQKRRYRILVSSPRGITVADGTMPTSGEIDPDADDPPMAGDSGSDSDDSAEEGIPYGDERRRGHTLSSGAMGLLKGPRIFSGRDKRSGQESDQPRNRHRRTNSTDVRFVDQVAISEELIRKDVNARYKEMEDLQLGRPERRERNKRLSVHFEAALSHRPSYDSLVYRGILKEWSEPSYKCFADFPSQLAPLVWSTVNAAEGKIEGWNVERGVTSDFVLGAHFALEDEGYVSFFENHFYKSDFITWWGTDEKFGPILVSMLKNSTTESEEIVLADASNPDITCSDSAVQTGSAGFGAGSILRRLGEKATGSKPTGAMLTQYRVLVQSKKGGKQLFIRSAEKSAEKIKALKVALGAQGYFADDIALNDMKFKKIKDIDIREDLLYLEKKFFSTDYKFGILYAKKGQNENEMFSNQTNDTSAHFKQFLALLGDRVTLKGFKGYTGGLDVKTDTTGQESVYTEYKDQRIMFHVSTLLPFYPRDEQQVERKRHLGNDIVVIVFAEPGASFDPSPMKTQFNHVYCVVSVEDAEPNPTTESTTDKLNPACRVRIEFAVKHGVRPFGPPLPDPSQTHFNLDNNFREFLLSKLINGERAALKSPAFATKMEKTRRIFIEQLIDTKIHPKK